MPRPLAVALLSSPLLLAAACSCCPPPRGAVPTVAGPSSPAAAPRPASPAVLVEMAFVRVDDAALDRLGDVPTGRSRRVLTREAAAALRARMEGVGAKALVAPSVIAAPGEEASIFVGETHAGAAPAPAVPAAERRDWSGWSARLVAKPDGDGVGLDVAFTLRPPPASTSPVDLEAMVASQTHAQDAATLRPGEALVMLVPAGEGGAHVGLFLQASLVAVPAR